MRRRVVHWVCAVVYAMQLPTLLRWWRHRRGDFRLYILEYHDISGDDISGDDSEPEGTICSARFRRHIRWLKQRFELTTVTTAVDRLQQGALATDLAVLTFDDGYLGNFRDAWPVLEAEGVPATIYLTSGFLDGQALWFDVARRALKQAQQEASAIETDRLAKFFGNWPPAGLEAAMRQLKYADATIRLEMVEEMRQAYPDLPAPAQPMSWQQARQMRDSGIELGAHTISHPILSRLDADAQEAEIRGSLERLEQELGSPPRSFAMPNGSARDYDENTLKILQQCGFAAACTTRRGYNRPGGDSFQLFRHGVGADSNAVLACRLMGLFDEAIRRWLPWR